MNTGLQIKSYNDQMAALITQASGIFSSLATQKAAMIANTTDFSAADVTEITNIISALKTSALTLTV